MSRPSSFGAGFLPSLLEAEAAVQNLRGPVLRGQLINLAIREATRTRKLNF